MKFPWGHFILINVFLKTYIWVYYKLQSFLFGQIFKNILCLFYMHECFVFMYVYASQCPWCLCRSEERAPDPLWLELQMIVNIIRVLAIESGNSARAASVLNNWAPLYNPPVVFCLFVCLCCLMNLPPSSRVHSQREWTPHFLQEARRCLSNRTSLATYFVS